MCWASLISRRSSSAAGQPLQFAATIETAPDFELPEYKGLPVKRELRTVSEADVERALTCCGTSG